MTKRVVTAAAVFTGVALAHFVVSIAGVVLGLRVWFDTAPGGTVGVFDLVVVRLGHFKGSTVGSSGLKRALELLMEAVPAR